MSEQKQDNVATNFACIILKHNNLSCSSNHDFYLYYLGNF